MNHIIFILILLASLTASAEETAPPVTVIELFTSQGCHSCPPADAFLGELAESDHVIALSCHVTYWNYLGWKDTFSLPFCNNRQRQYQHVLKGGERGVYTPQMIINGRYGVVGSRQRKVNEVIAADHQYERSLQAIQLTTRQRAQEQQLQVMLPALPSSSQHQEWQLFLFGTSGEHAIPIASGENAGKHLPYINPVEHIVNKGPWNGDSKNIEWSLPNAPQVREWLVLAQQWPLGEIVAAGRIRVSE
ncbi:DUF1223 domain-containing protein [Eionea flava]